MVQNQSEKEYEMVFLGLTHAFGIKVATVATAVVFQLSGAALAVIALVAIFAIIILGLIIIGLSS